MGAVLTETIQGADLIQQTGKDTNFIASMQEGAVWKPTVSGVVLNDGFNITCHPRESDNVSFVKALLNFDRQALSSSIQEFQMVVGLYGIPIVGDPQFIGEKVYKKTDISPSLVNETILFDLQESGALPPLKKINGTVVSGKIGLNIPMRYKNFESIYLEKEWLTNWNKRKTSAITGTSTTLTTYPLGPITIPFVSGMKTDFSDVRSMIWNGQSLIQCCHWKESYTPSSTAKFYVLIPTLSASATFNLYAFYGNANATYASNFTNTFNGCSLADDFEDGTIDTNKWTVVIPGGSPSVTETGGEIRVSGDGTHRAYLRSKNQLTPPYSINVRAKKSENIAIVWGWDGNTFSPADQPYNGWMFSYRGWTNPTVFSIMRYINGATVEATYDYSLDTNYYNYRIDNTGNGFTIYLDGTQIFTTTDYSFNTAGYIALTSREYPAAVNTYYSNMHIYPTGVSPTIGALSSEEAPATISPDSSLSDAMQILFSKPSDMTANCPMHVRANEYYSTEYESPNVLVNNQNILQLGFDNVDRYIALRFKIETLCADDVSLRFNYAQFDRMPRS